ncbi:MAG TPA: energy transducer TonB [Pyrinomonadaceae bacterium]|nr:energy transducer TonB [Pyrinomonadaceae bacterium]
MCCTLLLVAFDALAQSGGMAPPPSEWQRFRVRGEEYSIALPTVPALTTIKYPNWSAVRKERTERYLGVYADGVVYTIYSDDLEPQKSLKDSLKGPNMPAQGWEPATEQIVNHDGVTGKQFTSSHPLGGVIQVFATKKHFYRIQAFGATATDARVQHFFSSLTFGKKDDGIEVWDGPGKPFEPVDGSVKIPTDSVFTGKQVDRRIVLLQKPEPSYTEQARQAQITGTVVLKCVFSANGSVVNIEVKESLMFGLTDRAIEAAKKIKFIPASKDGKFVSQSITLEYNFNLY